MNIVKFLFCSVCICFVIAGNEVTNKENKNIKIVAVALNNATKQNEEDEVKCMISTHLCKPSGINVIK